MIIHTLHHMHYSIYRIFIRMKNVIGFSMQTEYEMKIAVRKKSHTLDAEKKTVAQSVFPWYGHNK